MILEITETALVGNAQNAGVVLDKIKAMGIRVYLDDFGTGYSSLSLLHSFHLDGLKIDRSFVANAAGRRQYAAIVQAISDLAHNLGMDVVAEGVEEQPQVALLQSLRCEHAQGFFFSPPVSQAEFEKILVRGGSTVSWPVRSAVA